MHQFKHFSTLPPFHSARIISQKTKFPWKKIILPLVKMLFKEIFWEINSWNTLCLLKKKQTPFEFTTLKSWKKNPSNLRCCENCCPLKKCIIEKIQTSETTNIKIKKKSLQIFPLQKKSKLLRCPHQHFLRKPFFLKKSQKLEGLCSNTNAAQPKKPTIQT